MWKSNGCTNGGYSIFMGKLLEDILENILCIFVFSIRILVFYIICFHFSVSFPCLHRLPRMCNIYIHICAYLFIYLSIHVLIYEISNNFSHMFPSFPSFPYLHHLFKLFSAKLENKWTYDINIIEVPSWKHILAFVWVCDTLVPLYPTIFWWHYPHDIPIAIYHIHFGKSTVGSWKSPMFSGN